MIFLVMSEVVIIIFLTLVLLLILTKSQCLLKLVLFDSLPILSVPHKTLS
ncbi:hypothetical protein J2TS4_31800 [Paenibacillus sp. J2TS4]|nr:hypothetical protein J2TS4_31800 [Paenibacillus sp. J2TS4]